jgi:EAL and modified HD-GYP domain-containing signal transduction protein
VKNGGTQEFTSPLLQLATTRGKTMELMVEQRKPGQRVSADIGFTVGVMSLMDTCSPSTCATCWKASTCWTR